MIYGTRMVLLLIEAVEELQKVIRCNVVTTKHNNMNLNIQGVCKMPCFFA